MQPMTPEEIKAYIESAIGSWKTWYLLFYILTPVGFAVVAYYLAPYLQTKAVNLATKEDVGELTKKVEGIKHELELQGHFGRTRYDREMEIYREIWPKIYELKQATLGIRPFFEFEPGEGETKESQAKLRREKWGEVAFAFIASYENTRPFYPHEVWLSLTALKNLTFKEARQSALPDKPGRPVDFYDEAMANHEEIGKHIDQLAEAIRQRLAKFDAA